MSKRDRCNSVLLDLFLIVCFLETYYPTETALSRYHFVLCIMAHAHLLMVAILNLKKWSAQ